MSEAASKPCARCKLAPRINHAYCKVCRNAIRRELYRRHAERYRAARRLHYIERHAEELAWSAAYRLQHRESLAAATRERYHERRESRLRELRERRRRKRLGLPPRCPGCNAGPAVPLLKFQPGLHLCPTCSVVALIGALSAVRREVILDEHSRHRHTETVVQRIHVCGSHGGFRCECGKLIVRRLRPEERRG